MRVHPLALVALLALSFAPVAGAAERFTLESLRRVVGVSSPSVSPDGRSVVFVVTRPNYTSDRNESEVWVADLKSGASRPLTVERGAASEPEWSPDGAQVSFLAPDSAGAPQVWALPMQGGDAHRLTRSATGVEHYAWRPDGGALAFAAPDSEPRREGEAKHLATVQIGDQDMFLREQVQPRHIWVQALDGSPAKRLTSGRWSLEFVLPPSSPPSRLSWSPDGRSIAFARVPAPQSGKFDSVYVAVVDVATGAIRALDGARRFQNNPRFSPDGRSISYVYPRDGRGDIGWVSELYLGPAQGGTGRSITRALDRQVYGGEWLTDGRTLLVAANDGTTVGLWMQPVDGAARRIDLGELVINGAFSYEVVTARTGAIVFVATTTGRPSELYVLDTPGARPRRLTDFNAWASEVPMGAAERVTWKSADGFAEDGVLVRPAGFDASRSYPLVLLIHGGPTSASKTNFSSLAQLMASEGWLVFMPNYRGSDNLGNAYESAIVGDWGAGPGRDVMAGLAELRKRPYVDPSRTAVTGWSYGGYMTTWLIGNYPGEWTSAMAGAPVTSWEDQYNLSDGSVTNRYGFGGSPWTEGREKLYREQSPITYATKIRTPTLVMANLEDFRVPPTQAMGLYHAMKDNGVETEYVGFRGRTHASGDPVNSRERARLWVDWVKRHFAGPGVP